MDSEIVVQESVRPVRRKRERGQHGLGTVYQHRANWRLDVKLKGERHRITLGAVKLLEKREARKIADEKIKELLMPKPVEKLSMPFSDFAKKYAAWAPEVKMGWERYRGKKIEETPLRHAVEFFDGLPLNKITPEKIEEFRLHMAKRKIAGRPVRNRTVNGYVKELRCMFNKAIDWEDAERNPVSKFKFADEQRQKSAARIIESDEEQNKLLSALPAWLRLIVSVGLQTGARRGDLVKLTWKSVHADHVEFLETKECRHRQVPLSETAQKIISMLRPPNADPDAFVFEPSVPRVTLISRIIREWKRARVKSGIQKLRFHDLRHTVGTRLVRGAVDLRTVQGILGHASLKTTERYLHSNDKLKQAAVETLNGFGHCLPPTQETASTEVVVNGRIQ